jgi:dihydrolipoamide dehydrogenase
VQADRVLVAVGRKPNTEGLNVEAVGVPLDERGRIKVGRRRFRAGEKNGVSIYAIGDVIAGPMLAHKAEEEGVACVEGIVTGYGARGLRRDPGRRVHAARDRLGRQDRGAAQGSRRAYRKGKFPFAANGRAKALGQTEGFVKILAHEQTDRILGVHIIGPRRAT